MTVLTRSPVKTILLLCVILISGSAFAETLDQPQGHVILTVSGSIGNTNGDGMARFDHETFAAIGISTLDTSTTWTEGKPRFTGVLGRDLMKAVGATGKIIHAVAVNDYKISIPIADFNNYNVILATSMNGKKLSLRDKGPIWVVYPKDDHNDLANEITDGKSIWQLVRIVVE